MLTITSLLSVVVGILDPRFSGNKPQRTSASRNGVPLLAFVYVFGYGVITAVLLHEIPCEACPRAHSNTLTSVHTECKKPRESEKVKHILV